MEKHAWIDEFPGSITVCDPQGIILEMNDCAARMFADDGGRNLIGSNVLECHPETARAKLKRMLESGQRNVYTIQKHGIKKLIYQSPWYQDGQYAGFVEMALEIPAEMPHFMRG